MSDWRYDYRPDRTDQREWEDWKQEGPKLQNSGSSPVVAVWLVVVLALAFAGIVLYWGLS